MDDIYLNRQEKSPETVDTQRFQGFFSLAGAEGLDSHACGRLVVGGRNRPPEGCAYTPSYFEPCI